MKNAQDKFDNLNVRTFRISKERIPRNYKVKVFQN